MRNPIHYGLCRQTVTVYHREGEIVRRTVIPNAFLELRRKRSLDRQGSRDSFGFLLVIPGEAQSVFVGDKILHGTGPEIDRAGWNSFTDCCVAQWAEQKFWEGRPVHTEAGA